MKYHKQKVVKLDTLWNPLFLKQLWDKGFREWVTVHVASTQEKAEAYDYEIECDKFAQK